MSNTLQVVTVDEALEYLGIDYADGKVKNNVTRAIYTADAYLKGSIGTNYPKEDARAKELALIIVADLYDNRGLRDTISGNTRKLVDDLSLQLKLELSREKTQEDILFKPPYIGSNYNWYVWDKTARDYIDTGISARGVRGDTGETGPQGEQGPEGYTPQKGADYWTPSDKAEIESYVNQKVIDNYSDLDDKITLTEIIAKGAEKAITYETYSEMVETLNALPKDFFIAGQGINIVTVGVPDIWVAYVEDDAEQYSYIDDETIVNALKETGRIKVGYFVLGQKETQKADLVDYAKKDQVPTINAILKDNGAYTLTISMGVE